MKIKFKELQAAVDWIGVNTDSHTVVLQIDHQASFYIRCVDKHGREVEIRIYPDTSAYNPSIRKTETLVVERD